MGTKRLVFIPRSCPLTECLASFSICFLRSLESPFWDIRCPIIWWSDYLCWQIFPFLCCKDCCTHCSVFLNFIHYDSHVLILIFITMVTPIQKNLKDYTFLFNCICLLGTFLKSSILVIFIYQDSWIKQKDFFLVCQLSLPEPFKRCLNIRISQHSTFWCHKYWTMVLSYAGGKRMGWL